MKGGNTESVLRVKKSVLVLEMNIVGGMFNICVYFTPGGA